MWDYRLSLPVHLDVDPSQLKNANADREVDSNTVPMGENITGINN